MKKIFSFGFVFLLVFVFGSFLINPVFADSVNITQINFTNSPQTINVNATSAIFTTQTQNLENASESVSETTTLNYTSTSDTGQFYNANATECTSLLEEPFELTMSNGTANKRFCYQDSTPGTHTLTVTASVDGVEKDWTPATQEIIIVAEPEPEPEPDPEPELNVTFIIRNGDSILFDDSVLLPASGTVEINDSEDVSHSVDTQSVLAIMKSIDDGSDAFSISNLQYFESFSSFYLKCILPDSGEELCDNWQYAVGNFTPFSSIDTTLLSGGETVGIYFGTSRQVVLSTNSITAGESLTATAQKYDYENNVWNPLEGVTIGVTLPNPDDPFNPIVVSTHPVDSSGNATITIADENTYTLGIVEDFYFPSYTVTVTPVPTGGGGGGGGDAPDTFDIEDALAYLKSVQAGDGSFGGALLYTDWAGVAFGSLNVTDSAKDLLLAYLSSHNEISSLLTDNERRAMALLALDENPYAFNGINYIKAITDSFDGAQFGDENLVNDDIFALIPLANAGYDEDDEIITEAVTFIISKQKANGSWEESVDVTSAGIQALKSFDAVAGVSEALSESEDYLVNEQENAGGWEDSVFSTSWAMQAMNALNESWEKNGNTPEEYLASKQEADGGLEGIDLNSRIWATSYAISAASGKTWDEILQNVSKQDEEGGGENNSSSEKSENPTPPKAEDPVVCPVGDLFSTATGQACTAFVETTPAVLDAPLVIQNIDTPSVNSANQNSSATSQTEESPEETEEVENIEITPEGLTASVSNAVPDKSIPKAVPIAVGTVSGLALLYFVSKFFFL